MTAIFVPQDEVEFFEEKARFDVTEFEVENAVLYGWNIYRTAQPLEQPRFYWETHEQGRGDEMVLSHERLAQLPQMKNGNVEVVIEL